MFPLKQSLMVSGINQSTSLFSRLSSLRCGWGSCNWRAPLANPEGGADGWCCVRVPGHPSRHEVPPRSTYCPRLVTTAGIRGDWWRSPAHSLFARAVFAFSNVPFLTFKAFVIYSIKQHPQIKSKYAYRLITMISNYPWVWDQRRINVQF